MLRQSRTFPGDHLERPILRLIQKVRQADGFALPRPIRCAIFINDRPEPNVIQFNTRFGMPTAINREELPKMKLLRTADDVGNGIRVPSRNAVGDGGKVRRGIIGGAILLLNERRVGLPFSLILLEQGILLGWKRIIGKNDNRPFALSRNPLFRAVPAPRL